MKERIRANLENFVKNISVNKVKRFSIALEQGDISLSDDFFKIKNFLNLDSNEARYFEKIMNSFTNYNELLLCLELVYDLHALQKKSHQNTVLVWTSPIKFHEKIDQTQPVFEEMINNSRYSITFVGYAMDEKNLTIFDAIKKAAKERSVHVKIIFDTANKERIMGKVTKSPKNIIEKIWGDIVHFPEIYTYEDKKGRSSLHAKFLVIDSEEIFVTSANMTGRAMNRNLEMGIRHKGSIAKDAEELLDLLIEQKILVKI